MIEKIKKEIKSKNQKILKFNIILSKETKYDIIRLITTIISSYERDIEIYKKILKEFEKTGI